MIKKIILIISLLSFSFWNIFAYNLENIKKLYIHKIDKIEQKIDSKYKDELKICYRKQNFYNKLDKILKLYEKKYTQYRLLFKVFLEINNYRELKLKNKCEFLKHQKTFYTQHKTQKNTKNFNNIHNTQNTNSSKYKNSSNTTKNNLINKNNNQKSYIQGKKQKNNKENNSNNVSNKQNTNKNTSSSEYNNSNNNNSYKDNTSKYNLDDNEKLKFKINLKNYDYNWDIKIDTTKYNTINLPTIWKIQKIYDNFTIKVNNHWIWLKKTSIITIWVNNPQDGISYIKDHYKKDYIFYIKDNDKYKYYLIDTKDISILAPFDPTKPLEYNLNQLTKAWYLYIKDFSYKRLSRDGIIVWWLFKYNNKLYYMSLIWSWRYYEIPKDKFLDYIRNIKKWSIIINQPQKNYLIWRKDWIKLFYLWNFETYKDINLENFWKIINFTFYIIWKYNLPYTVENMYKFINFAKQFEWKTLKDVYTWIILNFKYNKKVNDILNEKWMNQLLINKKVNADKNLIKNWDIFYSLEYKEWVCQSISDIFSLIALFYWKDADTIGWITKRWYLHQISKIWNKYYDPTFDLEWDSKTIHFNYFGMTRQQVEKYLTLKNK